MRIISTFKDIEEVKNQNIPQIVIDNAFRVVLVLNEHYGEKRDIYSDQGGYIILIEKKEDIDKIQPYTNGLSMTDIIFEYVEEYDWGFDTLYFKSAEFGITIIFLNESLSCFHRDFLGNLAKEQWNEITRTGIEQ